MTTPDNYLRFGYETFMVEFEHWVFIHLFFLRMYLCLQGFPLRSDDGRAAGRHHCRCSHLRRWQPVPP
jgi:hypothetical protein